MSRIFPPYANTIARASIIGGLVLLTALTGAIIAFVHSGFFTRVNTAITQPVQFSHEHHVGQLGLDCRYCHATVEKSSFADIPPVHTCMTCHSQIWVTSPFLAPVRDSYQTGMPIQWNRVYRLPDYVYFNHEIHINKGVGCETCHGRVDQMPLTVKASTLYMTWCLDCHNDPAKYVRPKENVFDMGYKPAEDQRTLGARLVKEYNIAPPSVLTDCWTCHR